jgi:hypothetical protein
MWAFGRIETVRAGVFRLFVAKVHVVDVAVAITGLAAFRA